MHTIIYNANDVEVGRVPHKLDVAALPVSDGFRVEHHLDADDVRNEAQRRIIALTGATSLLETITKQSNANMRANELNDKRLNGDKLTAQEQAEADALRALANAIKAIRAASNVMESNPPAGYADDANWP